jgi:hypothetical protein
MALIANMFDRYFPTRVRTQSANASHPESNGGAMAEVIDAVVAYILPRPFEQLCQKVDSEAIARCQTDIQTLRQTVQDQLKRTHTDVVLTLAQSDPTNLHLQVLKSSLLRHIKADTQFGDRLVALVDQIHTTAPSLQQAMQAQSGLSQPTATLVAEADRLSQQYCGTLG